MEAKKEPKTIATDIEVSIDYFKEAMRSAQETIRKIESKEIKDENRARLAIRSEVDKFRAMLWQITDVYIERD